MIDLFPPYIYQCELEPCLRVQRGGTRNLDMGHEDPPWVHLECWEIAPWPVRQELLRAVTTIKQMREAFEEEYGSYGN